MLEEFFAVTANNLYRVVANDGNGNPCIFLVESRKIKPRGKKRFSNIASINGNLLAIAKWLQLFNPKSKNKRWRKPERRLEKVDTRHWQGGTDRIVALFLDKEKARKCFELSGLKPCDSRWIEDTKEVVAAIGEDHPTITICHWPEMALVV